MKLKQRNKLILYKKEYEKEYFQANIIYISLAGRIGNILFQLAAAASLAKLHNCKFIAIPIHDKVAEPDNCILYEYLHQFKYTILRNIDIRKKPSTPYHNIYTEPFFHYKPINYSPLLLIYDYYQSEKYFDPLLIRKMFAIDKITKMSLSKKYGSILKFPNITSINVRRGDYLRHQDQFSVCSLKYYQQAIKAIGSNSPFLVTSDDLEWCKRSFKGENFYFAEQTNPTYDLYLQTLCKNNIISNSTFSWWGAWLNNTSNKTVIAPKKWFGPK